MQVPILKGIYIDGTVPEYRVAMPRNLIAVPTPQGISNGYLRSHDGIELLSTGPGIARGGIDWKGATYRVMGSRLVSVADDGSIIDLGTVGDDGYPVTMDFSFDRLGIASAGNLFYWNGSSLTLVTDPDLGAVVDMTFIAGYFMTTDGTAVITTDIDDPTSINPFHYEASESDPSPVVGVWELRDEAYMFNRYSIQTLQNVGGSGFPFAIVPGARVPRGAIGTHAICEFLDTFAFVGSGKNMPPQVYLMGNGTATAISTQEVDKLLQTYTEEQLSQCVLEPRVDKAHKFLYLHLPDRSLLYDAAASQVLGEAAWSDLSTSVTGPADFRGRFFVWSNSRWTCGDSRSANLGVLKTGLATHFSDIAGWEFTTPILFNETRGGIVSALELVGLPGYVPVGVDPTIWTSYWDSRSPGWSQERPVRSGVVGQVQKRLQWRKQGRFNLWRIQRFRGADPAPVAFARLELTPELLVT